MNDVAKTTMPSTDELSQLTKRIAELERELAKISAGKEPRRESESIYRAAFEFGIDPIFWADVKTGTIIDCNRAAEELIGLPRDQIVGRHQTMLHPPELKEFYVGHFRRHTEKGSTEESEAEVLSASGQRIPVVISATRLKLGAEDIIQGVFHDITDRKRAEEALKENEGRFRRLAENAKALIFRISLPDGKYEYLSPALSDISGYGPEELYHDPLLLKKLIHPGWADYFDQEWHKLLAGDVPPVYEYKIIHKSGKERWMHQSNTLIRNIDGAPKAIEGIVMDITSRREAEKKSRNMLRFLQALFNTIPSPIFCKDTNGRYVDCNREFEQYIGFKRRDIIGKGVYDMHPKEIADKYHEMDSALFRHPGRQIYEYQLMYADGNKRDVVVNKATYRNADGVLAGLVGVMVDITERKWAEEALQRAHNELEQRVADRTEELIRVNEDLRKKIAEHKRAEETLRERDELQRAIFDSVGDFIFIKNQDRRYVMVNNFYQKRFHIDSEIFTGKTDAEIPIFENKEETTKIIKDTDSQVLQGDTVEYEMTHRICGSLITFNIIKTPLRGQQGRITGICGISRDVTERKLMEQDRQRDLERLKKSLGATVKAISVIVDIRDPYTAGHQRHVADLARSIAKEMDLAMDRIDGLRIAGTIHDIGKISVPAEILSMPRKLTDIEFILIKDHPQSGYGILKDVEFPWPIARMVLEHHERMDGSGYPNGLTGDNLLLESRILAVADVVESMSSHRPYRPALGIDAALDEITKNRGILYDPEVVDVCLQLFQEKGYRILA